MYRERTEMDVRRGLLRIVVHVLQHHGEDLTRGWVPLLRLLEAVPRQRVSEALLIMPFCFDACGSKDQSSLDSIPASSPHAQGLPRTWRS